MEDATKIGCTRKIYFLTKEDLKALSWAEISCFDPMKYYEWAKVWKSPPQLIIKSSLDLLTPQ